jgi:hypothetical protein
MCFVATICVGRKGASFFTTMNPLVTPTHGAAVRPFTPATSPPVSFPPLVSDAQLTRSPNESDLLVVEEEKRGGEEVDKRRYLKPTADKSRNQKRRKTSSTLDSDDKPNRNRNILLPLDSLLTFLEANFNCKYCRRTLRQTDEPRGGQQTPSPHSRSTWHCMRHQLPLRLRSSRKSST